MFMKTNKKFYQRRRLWLIPFAIIAVAILVIFVVGQFTPVVNALIIRQASTLQSNSPAPNFGTIQQNVAVAQDIVYDEIENSVMDIYYPKDAQGSLPVVVWLHGGGYVLGDKDVTREYAMTLASHGYVVANVNYALAPEHKYPTPILQANQALKYLNGNAAKYGGDMHRLFLGGNSAGAQIAGQIAAITSNERLAKSMGIKPAIENERLRGVLLFCSIYDMKTVRETGAPFLETFMWSYTGMQYFENYPRIDELSTVKQITPEYPPVFVSVGDADPLESQSIELIKALENNGVEVDPVLFNGTNANLGHDYQYNLASLPAQQTLAKVVNFLDMHN
jgi:acetyl esterase/lipase